MQKISSLVVGWRSICATLCLLLPLFFSCSPTPGVRFSELPEGKNALFRLAVLPFQDAVPEGHDEKMATCPLCGSIFQTDQSTQAAGTVMDDILLESIREHKQFTVIDPDKAAEVYRRTAASPRAPLVATLQNTGKELGVDGILVGYIFRYRERKGYSYSVEKPASVAFDLHLVRVSDGLVVWSGVFDKTQSSLMENLFQLSSFYKRGIKWLTAREMSEDGIAGMMKTFPGVD